MIIDGLRPYHGPHRHHCHHLVARLFRQPRDAESGGICLWCHRNRLRGLPSLLRCGTGEYVQNLAILKYLFREHMYSRMLRKLQVSGQPSQEPQVNKTREQMAN